MLTYVLAFAEYAAQVRNAERYESYRSADGYSAGDQEHDGKKKKRLMDIAEFDFTFHVPGKAPRSQQCGSKAYGKEAKGEDDIPRCHTLEIEVSRSPEIILLQEVSVGGIGHDDGAQGTDEGAEKDTEGDKVLRAYAQCDDKTDQGADKGTDETAHRQGAPSGHGGRSCTKTSGAAQPETIYIAELVAPEILHLHSSYRQSHSCYKYI